MLEFLRPWWLLALFALPLIAFVSLRLSYASLGPWQKWISLGVRIIIWTLLSMSLAGVQFVKRSDRVSVIVALDTSDSVDSGAFSSVETQLEEARKTMRKDDSLGKVNFGADAYLEMLPQHGVDERMLRDWQSKPRANFTDIGEALQLAMASFPDNAQKRLVLITDGNENVGNALAESRMARENDIELVTVPVSGRSGDEVVLESLEAPAQASLGETVNVRFVVNSTLDTQADVTVMRNGQYVGKRRIDVQAGKRAYEFPMEVDSSGFFTYELQLEPVKDTIAENNRAYTFSVVQGQPRLLYATGDPSEQNYLPRTLQNRNIQVDVVPPSGIPYSLEDFQTYDGIIFSDVAAYEISPEQMKMVQVLVRDFGRGFLMLGGEKSFGPGGYFDTPIEETLPVDMDFRRKRIYPSTLVVCLIDKSGSMGATVNGVDKLTMAKEACKAVVDLQTPADYVGVMGFDGIGQWVVEPTQGADKNEIINKISSMQAGGGTDLYPALKSAYESIGGIKAQVKHFIVFTDGMVAPGDFEGLAKQMANDKVTISTVAFGTDADIPFMKELAELGGGNMYEAKSLDELPRVFTREVFLANKATLNEDPFQARPVDDDPLVSSVNWAGAPPLLGYVTTAKKERAQVHLMTGKDDPLLATWRYGLGKSAAFTSDAKNRWAAGWLDWSGYERFFTGVARWIRSDIDDNGLQVKTSIVGREATVQVQAPQASAGEASFETRITDPDLNSSSVKMDQVGPGVYEGHFEVGGNGNYFVNVLQSEVQADGSTSISGAQAAGLAVSYSPEYRDLSQNTFLLTQLGESSAAPEGLSLAELFTRERHPTKRLEDAWELFTLIALLLWMFDVAARRLSLEPEQWRLATAAVLAGPGGARAAQVRSSLASLQQAKQRAGRPGRPVAVRPPVEGPAASAGGPLLPPRPIDPGQSPAAPPARAGGAKPASGAASGDLSALRSKLGDKPAQGGPSVPLKLPPERPVAPSAAPPPPRTTAPLTDSEFTKRLLEKKRQRGPD